MQNTQQINTNFESEAILECDGKTYNCEILHSPEGVCTLKFCKPEVLKGLAFSWQDDKYTISYGELSGEFNLEPLCEKSGVSTMIKLFDVISNKENLTFVSKEESEETFAGKIDAMDFEVVVDKNGNILHINLPSQNFRADFQQPDGEKKQNI